MSRSQTTAAKRQRQEQKRAKARTKEERREARHAGGTDLPTPAVEGSETQLVEEFAALHQDFESGVIDRGAFEERREQIRAQLEQLQ